MSVALNTETLLPSALEDAETRRRAATECFLTILPGDVLKENRYRPFRKLGEGQFASVWLALDKETNKYVAIKIGVTWMLQQQARESSLLCQLRQRPLPSHPGERHVVELLDDFHHQGPSGEHACLVFRPLGRQLETVFDDYLERPAPHSFCRKVSIQALQALAYLHKQSIMHGDIHPGNLMLALTYDIDSKSEDDIWKENTKGNELNDRDDSFPLDDKTILSDTAPTNANIVLIDLGAGSYPAEAENHTYAYPILYRSPEVVVGASVNFKADIWALGCVIFRIVTGLPLFAIESWGDIEETNVERMYSFIERLGPVPDSIRTLWPDADQHVTVEGLLKNPFPEEERDLPLADAIRDAKPEWMEEDELAAFVEFLLFMICFDSAERKTTQELLEHRWVTDFQVD